MPFKSFDIQRFATLTISKIAIIFFCTYICGSNLNDTLKAQAVPHVELQHNVAKSHKGTVAIVEAVSRINTIL